MTETTYSTQELTAFDTVADFLYPNNGLDPEALGLFVDGYLHNIANSNSTYKTSDAETKNQHLAMGVLLKKLETSNPYWEPLFKAWYGLHRVSKPTYIHAWFCSISEQTKEYTKHIIKALLSGAPAVELRVTLMMDGVEHYPNEDIRTFVGKSLLRVKSTTFVKALKPKISQMPLVLKMSNALKATAPEYTELAEAMALGVFVQRLGEKPAVGNPQRNYSAVEAMRMMVAYNAMPSVEKCITAAKSRFKGETLLRDLMEFVVWAMQEDPNQNWLYEQPTVEEQKAAAALLPCVLTDLLKRPVSEMKSNTYDHVLVNTFGKLEASEKDPLSSPLLEWFVKRMTHGQNVDASVLPKVLKQLPAQTQDLWNAWMIQNKVTSFRELIEHAVSPSRTHSHYRTSNKAYNKSLCYVASSDDLKLACINEAVKIFTPETGRDPQAGRWAKTPEQAEHEIHRAHVRDMETYFDQASFFMNAELKEDDSFKNLMAACTMTYLYFTSTTWTKFTESNGLFVNISAQPIPVLKALYPEHQLALNTLRKDVLRTKNYHAALYNVLSSVLYEGNTADKSVIAHLTESVDSSVFEYFRSAMIQNNVNFEVESSIFEGMSL